jgi:signal transduction histidine kinase
LELAPEGQARIKTIQHLLARSSYEMRSAIFALNQHEIHKGHGLLDLLHDLIADFQRQCGINATLIAGEDLGDLPFSLVEAIYRLVREALNNVYKHSNATSTFVSLKREANSIVLTIQDDGSGLPEGQPLDAVEASLHFGVNSMRQLVATFGGQFTIQNNDEEGVIVKAVFPIDWSSPT